MSGEEMPAILTTGMITTFDDEKKYRDLSDIYHEIKLPETPFFNALSRGDTVSNTKLEWWDNIRPAISTTLVQAYNTSQTLMRVADASAIRNNMLLTIENSLYKVSAVNLSTNTITITVLDANANHPNGSKVEFVGNAQKEGSEYEDSDRTQDVKRYNVTQIFTDYVKISDTEKSVKNERKEDVLSRQTRIILTRLKYLKTLGVIRNIRYEAVNKSEGNIFGGVRWFIKQYGYNPAAAVFSPANLDAFLNYSANELGYTPTELWMNPVTHAQNFNPLSTNKIIIEQSDRTRGEFVKTYISGSGLSLTLNVDPAFPQKEIFCLNRNNIRYRPLSGRDFFIKRLAEDGDYEKYQIVGEYTLEVNDSAQMSIFTLV